MKLDLRARVREFVIWPFLDRFWLQRLHNKRYRSENVYVIFSEARGGSTWLMEMLNQRLNAFICWEPLHPRRGIIKVEPEVPALSHKDVVDAHAEKKISSIFSGAAINAWTVSKNNSPLFKSNRNYDRLLIKFVRGNRILKDLGSFVSLQNKPILLLRHPAATLFSQKKRFRVHMLDYFNKGYLNEDPEFLKHKDFFSSLKTDLQKEFFLYCFNNRVVLRQWDSLDCIPLFYEELIVNAEQELDDVFDQWNISRKIGPIQSRKTSSEGSREGNVVDPEMQLKKWSSKVSDEKKIQMQKVFNYFDIRVYNMQALGPQKP